MKYVINVLNNWVNILNITRMKWIIQKKNKCFKKLILYFVIGPIDNAVNVLSIDGRVLVLSCLWCFANRRESSLWNKITSILDKHLYNQNIQRIPFIHSFFLIVISGSVAHSSSFPKSILVGEQNGFENSYFILSNVKFFSRSTFIDNNCWIRGSMICRITLSICSLFGFRWPHIGEDRFRGSGGIGDNDVSKFGDRLGARGWRHTLGESTYKNNKCNKKYH